jgi:hypothetical protein
MEVTGPPPDLRCICTPTILSVRIPFYVVRVEICLYTNLLCVYAYHFEWLELTFVCMLTILSLRLPFYVVRFRFVCTPTIFVCTPTFYLGRVKVCTYANHFCLYTYYTILCVILVVTKRLVQYSTFVNMILGTGV